MRWAPEHPINARMIFLSATDGAGGPTEFIPAWDRYQGGCLPRLRERLAGHPEHISRARLISADHGLIHPSTMVGPEAGVMTDLQANEHQPLAREKMLAEFGRDGAPREVMVLADYPYSRVVDDLFHFEPPGPWIRLFTMWPGAGWPLIAAVLDAWGWP